MTLLSPSKYPRISAMLVAMPMLLACALPCIADSWHKYPVYNDGIDYVVTTPDNVYFQSGTSMFAYNTDEDETIAFTSLTSLSGSQVINMYANYHDGYVLVAYEDGNIDVVYDDGKVVNLPEIRDANNISGSKVINDVAFGNDIIAVATNFGLVIYDAKKLEVKESGIYNCNVQSVAVADGYLCISYYSGGDMPGLWISKIDGRHGSLSDFSYVGDFDMRSMRYVGDNVFLYIANNPYRLCIMKIDFETVQCTENAASDFTLYKPYIGEYDEGYYAMSGSQMLLWKNGKLNARSLPEMLRGQYLAIAGDEDEVWAGDADGLGCYDIGNAAPTVLHDKIRPQNAITCLRPGYMRWSPDGRRLYISNIESSAYKSYAQGEAVDAYQTTNVIENGYASDVSLLNASADMDFTKNFQTLHSNKRMYGDPTWIIEDPDDSDIYYCGNSHEGLYVCAYDESTGQYAEIGKVTHANSPLKEQYSGSTRVQDVNIDPAGNLWVGALGAPYYAILPSEKRRAGVENALAIDWIAYDRLSDIDIDQKEFCTLFCKKSNMVFLFSGKWQMGIVAIDTKGTYADPTDDVVCHLTSFVDQDGIEFDAPQRTTFAIEDARGCVWVGTSSGVFEITSPATAATGQLRVRRIKVSRNDGTNLADYLLDGEMVNWMSVDHSDRKWIATDNSGLYLVSETGDEILKNYTSYNSPLESMTVCTVECDPYSNSVYMGTPAGLYSYLSDSAPAASSYSEILAYPNPVRPEYSGAVTIKGLMNNSIVKIVDASGHLVYQTRSEGGMAQWPCKLQSGGVRSGVYYVLASSAEGGESAVGKILVVN